MLIKLERDDNEVINDELINEIRTYIDRTLRMHPSDADIFSKLTISKLKVKNSELEMYASKYLKSAKKMDKLPISGIKVSLYILMNGLNKMYSKTNNGPGKNDHRSAPEIPNEKALLDGTERRTTLMIRNIPNKYTQSMLLEELNEVLHRKFDFFYLPIDFRKKTNMGYAFINMIDPVATVILVKQFHGKGWRSSKSEKICQISYARIQGKHALVEQFRNSTVMSKKKQYHPIIFHSSGHSIGMPELFPGDTTNTFLVKLQNFYENISKGKDVNFYLNPRNRQSKEKIVMWDKKIDKIMKCSKHIAKRDPTNLYALGLLEQHYNWSCSINTNEFMKSMRNQVSACKLIETKEWLKYCVNAIEYESETSNQIHHFQRFLKYAQKVKEDDLEWFDNFAESKLWWKDVYSHHTYFREVEKLLFTGR